MIFKAISCRVFPGFQLLYSFQNLLFYVPDDDMNTYPQTYKTHPLHTFCISWNASSGRFSVYQKLTHPDMSSVDDFSKISLNTYNGQTSGTYTLPLPFLFLLLEL